MSNVTLGLSAILGKVGEPSSETEIFKEEGYKRYGYTYQDTAKMSMEDDTVNEFFAEEEDEAIDELIEAGKITFNFSVMDPDLPTLKRLFGGEVASDVWNYPDAKASIEESIIVKSRKGLAFHIPRGLIKAKLTGDFSKKSLLLLECTVTARKPKNTALKKLYAKKITPATAE